MGRRRVGVGLLLALGLVVGWALWPSAPAPVPQVGPSAERRAPTKPATAPPALPAPSTVAEPPDDVEVRCALPAGVPEQGDLEVRGGRRVRRGVRVAARGPAFVDLAVRADLVEPLPEAEAPTDLVGKLVLPGGGELDFVLAVGGGALVCSVAPWVPHAFVSGRVLTREGLADDRIVVSGCGRSTRLDSDGSFYLEVPATPCVLQAQRRDGMFHVRSAPVPIDPRAGDEVVLDLTLPSFRAAGVGTTIAAVEEGIAIQRVVPGSPAEAAGLRRGDVVVALDGASVVGLEAEDFVDLALGREGTEVVYTLLRQGEEVDVVLVRATIDPP